eukprot:1162021-Pelagomonas_calceolata.AAC.14
MLDNLSAPWQLPAAHLPQHHTAAQSLTWICSSPACSKVLVRPAHNNFSHKLKQTREEEKEETYLNRGGCNNSHSLNILACSHKRLEKEVVEDLDSGSYLQTLLSKHLFKRKSVLYGQSVHVAFQQHLESFGNSEQAACKLYGMKISQPYPHSNCWYEG